MNYSKMSFAAAALVLAACQTVAAQGYTPTPPVARPNIMPKPVANRLIKREAKPGEAQAPAQPN
jgi:hypothetical protein